MKHDCMKLFFCTWIITEGRWGARSAPWIRHWGPHREVGTGPSKSLGQPCGQKALMKVASIGDKINHTILQRNVEDRFLRAFACLRFISYRPEYLAGFVIHVGSRLRCCTRQQFPEREAHMPFVIRKVMVNLALLCTATTMLSDSRERLKIIVMPLNIATPFARQLP